MTISVYLRIIIEGEEIDWYGMDGTYYTSGVLNWKNSKSKEVKFIPINGIDGVP